MKDRVLNTWTVGPYVFAELEVTWKGAREIQFTYAIDGKESNERTLTLDKAIITAVGERHTGRRGAGGTAVGTAADWFAVMIGLEPAPVKSDG